MSGDTTKELLKHTSKDFDEEKNERKKISGYLIDASISDCHDMKKALEWVISKGLKLIITSISLEELDRLQKKEPDSDSAKGARYILRIAAEDSKHAFDVIIIDRDYHIPDDSILKYCIDNKDIGIITSDKVMTLKAKAFNIECIYLSKTGTFEEPKNIEEVPYQVTNESKEETLAEKAERLGVKPACIVHLADFNIENETKRAYISRKEESFNYKRHFYRENGTEEVEKDSDKNFYLQNGDEIIILSYEAQYDVVHYEYLRVIDITSQMHNAYRVSKMTFMRKSDLRKIAIDERGLELTKAFLNEISANYKALTTIKVRVVNGVHYYTTRNSQKIYHALMNKEGVVLPYDAEYELNIGDTILELNFNQKNTVIVKCGVVEKFTNDATFILVDYDGEYSLGTAREKIKIKSKALDEVFQNALIGLGEDLIDLPNSDFHDGFLWSSTSFFGNVFYQLHVNGLARTINQSYQASVGSFLWEIKHLHDNVWGVYKYEVKRNSPTKNAKLVIEEETILQPNGTFKRTKNPGPNGALVFLADILKKKKEAEEKVVTPKKSEELLTMPYAKVCSDYSGMLSKSYHTNNIVVLVCKNGSFTKFDKEVLLKVGDYMIVITLDKGRYFYSKLVLEKIASQNNCKREIFINGSFDGKYYTDSKNEEINGILTNYLGYLR